MLSLLLLHLLFMVRVSSVLQLLSFHFLTLSERLNFVDKARGCVFTSFARTNVDLVAHHLVELILRMLVNLHELTFEKNSTSTEIHFLAIARVLHLSHVLNEMVHLPLVELGQLGKGLRLENDDSRADMTPEANSSVEVVIEGSLENITIDLDHTRHVLASVDRRYTLLCNLRDQVLETNDLPIVPVHHRVVCVEHAL